jgi:hypothetical protein
MGEAATERARRIWFNERAQRRLEVLRRLVIEALRKHDHDRQS